MSTEAPIQNLDAARAFLAVIDPTNSRAWTFQTFDDSGFGRRHLTRIFHGSIDEHAADLIALNNAGAGIFVMANAGDLAGRKAANVHGVRTLFLDIDKNGAQTITNVMDACKQTGTWPTAVIQTSAMRFSVFWRVTDCRLADFEKYQKCLALRFGTDGSVCDLSRVMRLPGFIHRKREPFRSELPVITDAVYDARKLIDALCPQLPPASEARATLPDDTDAPGDAIARAEAGLSEGGRNAGLFKALCAARYAGTARETADALAQKWAARCTPPLDPDEAMRCVASAYAEHYLAADAEERERIEKQTGRDEATNRELQRLSELGSIAYARERKEAAKRLGIGVGLLDEEVKAMWPKPDGSALVLQLLGDGADPDPWPELVEGTTVLEAMRGLFEKHCRLPEHGSHILAVWTLATWSLDAFDKFPFLRLHSATPGCGKSTVLDVVQRLCRRPLRADNVSPAVVFRVLDATECSLLLDEAETAFANEGSESLRGILNGGHTRSGGALRIVGDNHDTPKHFRTWGPKVFAHLRQLPGTITDRSLSIALIRARSDEQPQRIKESPEWREIRCKAMRWAADNLDRVREHADRDTPQWLPNRIGDNWRPILGVAKAIGEACEAATLAAARAAVESSNASESQDTGIALLTDIRKVFAMKQAERISSSELLGTLTTDAESRWSEFSHGRALTARQLARILGDFGIKSKTIRIRNGTGPGSTPHGYDAADFAEVWLRYLPTSPNGEGTRRYSGDRFKS